MTGKKFLYTEIPPFSGGMPIVTIRLSQLDREISIPAIVDSGAALNVLPYDYGLQLGFVWEEQRLLLPVGGLLQGAEAYAVLAQTTIDPFPPVDLAFAWINKSSHEVRTLLGQVNFFQYFRVVFEGYKRTFEIAPAETL
ncbi:MAG: hypothetical protein GY749_05850 [Desulfobacteraceae bacterium]|nr:hypothetical protein [Desulfobacteraceae bacterium]